MTRVKTKSAKPRATQGERLQKVLAAAGFGSRRQCESLLLEGRVEVDRQVVTQLGTRVDAETQKVRVDGVLVRPPRKFYYMVNKPAGVVSTSRDPWARTRVIDLIDTDQRLFTVGRLDRSTTGMILVTNDGELANRLTHPRYGIEKTYWATVAGRPSPSALGQLRKGVHLAEGVARVEGLKTRRRLKDNTVLELVLTEGKNREIRRVLARIGHKVLRLQRVSIGPLRLGQLPVGENRKLTYDEVKALKRFASGDTRKKSTRRKPHRAARKRSTAKSQLQRVAKSDRASGGSKKKTAKRKIVGRPAKAIKKRPQRSPAKGNRKRTGKGKS